VRKLLNKPWFVALLAIGAIVFVTMSVLDQGNSRRPRARRAPPPPAAAVEPAAAAIDPDTGEAVVGGTTTVSVPETLAALVFPASIPDPFAHRETTVVAGEPEPAAGPVAPDQVDAITLTAVWRQGQVALALVNDRILRAGDTIGRLTIDEVAIEGIWVSHWKGRDFVAFGAAFRLLTPPAQSFALHEN